MIRLHKNAPLVSSAGRLFDSVAAAIGLCRESVSFEGQAAMQLQGLAEKAIFDSEPDGCSYPFKIGVWPYNGLPYLDPLPMWQTLLGDLTQGIPSAVIALRFHRGLAQGLLQLLLHLQMNRTNGVHARKIVLSGGVFQNELLAQMLETELQEQGLLVLRPAKIPCNDGGISMGQAIITVARILDT